MYRILSHLENFFFTKLFLVAHDKSHLAVLSKVSETQI